MYRTISSLIRIVYSYSLYTVYRIIRPCAFLPINKFRGFSRKSGEECGEDERGASESDHLRTEVNRLTAQLALAQLALARKALAPFARAAGRFDPQGNTLADNRRQQAILWSAKDREYEITSQDCLTAREALQVISGNTGGQGDDH